MGISDKTHFVINIENGKTLGFLWDDDVKFAEVVSGGEGMNMIVRQTGGRDACMASVFVISHHNRRIYPSEGVPDNVPGACYRTGPKV